MVIQMEAHKKITKRSYQMMAMILLGLAIPTLAQAAYNAPVGFTPGRLVSLVPLILGLFSVITGSNAMRAAGRNNFNKRKTNTALYGGLVCIVLSTIHLSQTTGGYGTGSGKAGSILATLLGVSAVILGLKALSRKEQLVKSGARQI
jgi:hypothetical protein